MKNKTDNKKINDFIRAAAGISVTQNPGPGDDLQQGKTNPSGNAGNGTGGSIQPQSFDMNAFIRARGKITF